MKPSFFLIGIATLLVACQPKNNSTMIISPSTIQSCITAITEATPEADSAIVARGVQQVAVLWN